MLTTTTLHSRLLDAFQAHDLESVKMLVPQFMQEQVKMQKGDEDYSKFLSSLNKNEITAVLIHHIGVSIRKAVNNLYLDEEEIIAEKTEYQLNIEEKQKIDAESFIALNGIVFLGHLYVFLLMQVRILITTDETKQAEMMRLIVKIQEESGVEERMLFSYTHKIGTVKAHIITRNPPIFEIRNNLFFLTKIASLYKVEAPTSLSGGKFPLEWDAIYERGVVDFAKEEMAAAADQ